MELMKKTIGQYLKEQAAVIGSHTAMEMFGWSCDFAQLDEVSGLLAGRLDKMGNPCGDLESQQPELGIYLPCTGEDRSCACPDQYLLPG